MRRMRGEEVVWGCGNGHVSGVEEVSVWQLDETECCEVVQAVCGGSRGADREG